MYKILGCGALNLDYLFVVDSLDHPVLSSFGLKAGEELCGSREKAAELLSFLKDNSIISYKCAGGSSANTIAVLSHLGCNCGFCGVVGNDPEGEIILSSIKGQIDTSFIKREGLSSICIVVLDKNNRDRALFVVGPKGSRFPSLEELDLSKFDIFHFSSLVQEDGLGFQVKLAQKYGFDHIISFDPGEIYAKKEFNKLINILAMTDLLFLTERELKLLTGKNTKDAIEELLILLSSNKKSDLNFYKKTNFKIPMPVVILKKGPKGAEAYYLSKSKVVSKVKVKACPVSDIVDNTGAGDSLAAGFIYGAIKGCELLSALKMGVFVASLSLRDFGRRWLDSVGPKLSSLLIREIEV